MSQKDVYFADSSSGILPVDAPAVKAEMEIPSSGVVSPEVVKRAAKQQLEAVQSWAKEFIKEVVGDQINVSATRLPLAFLSLLALESHADALDKYYFDDRQKAQLSSFIHVAKAKGLIEEDGEILPTIRALLAISFSQSPDTSIHATWLTTKEIQELFARTQENGQNFIDAIQANIGTLTPGEMAISDNYLQLLAINGNTREMDCYVEGLKPDFLDQLHKTASRYGLIREEDDLNLNERHALHALIKTVSSYQAHKLGEMETKVAQLELARAVLGQILDKPPSSAVATLPQTDTALEDEVPTKSKVEEITDLANKIKIQRLRFGARDLRSVFETMSMEEGRTKAIRALVSAGAIYPPELGSELSTKCEPAEIKDFEHIAIIANRGGVGK